MRDYDGSLGTRYGRKIRKNYAKIKEKKSKKYVCPICGKEKVVRVASGIWICKACNTKFAGGAYEFATLSATKIYSSLK